MQRCSWNQSAGIATKHPEKIEEMRAMFAEEAKKYQVFPIAESLHIAQVARKSGPRIKS